MEPLAALHRLHLWHMASRRSPRDVDRFGRIQDQKWTDGTDPIDHYGYGYDRNSNRLYRENVLAATRSEVYAYDALDRLTEMDRGTLNEQKTAITGTPTREEDWNLTQTGNWAGYDVDENGQPVLVQTRDNNKANEIIGIDETTGPEWVTPEWDARGNMVYGPRPGDEATEAEALLMVYDAWNRPVEFWEDTNENGDLDDPGDTQILECRYDGLGRRIQKTVKDVPEVTFDYYYSGRQVVEVRKGGSEHPYEQYVWGLRYVHSPVLRWWDENTDGQDIETLYYTNDANFNVTALVNDSGSVVERYTYDPYGKVTFRAADWSPLENNVSAYANEILFTGHRLDTETGLYITLYRYYHPGLGCWLSRDPVAYADGMSLYQYVVSSPLLYGDPSGLITRARLLYKGIGVRQYTERQSIAKVCGDKIACTVPNVSIDLGIEERQGKCCVIIEDLEWSILIHIAAKSVFPPKDAAMSKYERNRDLLRSFPNKAWYDSQDIPYTWESVFTHEFTHALQQEQVMEPLIEAVIAEFNDRDDEKYCRLTLEGALQLKEMLDPEAELKIDQQIELHRQFPPKEEFGPGEPGEYEAVEAERKALEEEYQAWKRSREK